MKRICAILIFGILSTFGKSSYAQIDERKKVDTAYRISDPELKQVLDSLMAQGYSLDTCAACTPPGMLESHELAGITAFNEKGIYYNRHLPISEFEISAFTLKRLDSEITTRCHCYRDSSELSIYHWKFMDDVQREKFENHVEYINRYLWKYKEWSAFFKVGNQWFQYQEMRFIK
ncbi:hypothetical protein [Catalinimonas alkaloidigena]|uniref:hypothetical protein n=1 Tax=Catalinimonas alkaloidigena TaxID=1075417 RepID=UPI00115FF148|nr:hypothetical protein [Catalinimonas alkaloidigena]